MTTLSAIILSASALLIGSTAYADENVPHECLALHAAFSSEVADAGGYSLATGEQAVDWAAFVAYVEGMDGGAHPAFGNSQRDVLILRTESGHYVVRILGPRREAILN